MKCSVEIRFGTKCFFEFGSRTRTENNQAIVYQNRAGDMATEATASGLLLFQVVITTFQNTLSDYTLIIIKK